MAAFKKSAIREDWKVYQLLRFGPVSLFYKTEVLEEALLMLRGLNYTIHSFDCREYNSEAALFNDILINLGILQEDYVGINITQFWDLFTEVEVPDDSGLIIVFTSFEALQTKFPDCAQDVLEIVAGYHYKWLWLGLRFKAFVQTNDPLIQLKPLATLSAQWNDRESAFKNRLPQTES